MARVEFTDPALEDLNGFDNSSKQAILLGLRKLETEPHKRGLILSGNLHPLRRLVVGKNVFEFSFRLPQILKSAKFS